MSRQRKWILACSALSVSTLIVLGLGICQGGVKRRRTTPHIQQQVSDETAADQKPELDIKSVVQHGHIVEIIAETQPGTTVMINGQRAAIFDFNIRHFVGPLPDGVNNITVTAQNQTGGVNTQHVAVVLP